MSGYEYDLLVIGSGPGGTASRHPGRRSSANRVAVIERKASLGGGTNTGTIPSKTLREAVLYFSGYRERNLYGVARAEVERHAGRSAVPHLARHPAMSWTSSAIS